MWETKHECSSSTQNTKKDRNILSWKHIKKYLCNTEANENSPHHSGSDTVISQRNLKAVLQDQTILPVIKRSKFSKKLTLDLEFIGEELLYFYVMIVIWPYIKCVFFMIIISLLLLLLIFFLQVIRPNILLKQTLTAPKPHLDHPIIKMIWHFKSVNSALFVEHCYYVIFSMIKEAKHTFKHKSRKFSTIENIIIRSYLTSSMLSKIVMMRVNDWKAEGNRSLQGGFSIIQRVIADYSRKHIKK